MLGSLRVIALALPLLLLPQAAASAGELLLTGYDTIDTPGAQVTLRMKVEKLRLIRWDKKGVDVDFWLYRRDLGRWSFLGAARSADDGYADLQVAAPTVAGDHYVAGRVSTGQGDWSEWEYSYLGVRPQGSLVVVTDIDHTINADGFQLFGSNGNAQPLNGALDGVTALSATAAVVYVTARDDYFTDKTRDWLATWRFPEGALYLSDDRFLGLSDPTDYKAATVARLKARFDVRVAFGDKTTDDEAYRRNQVPSLIFTDEPGDFPLATGTHLDWVELRAAVAQGAYGALFDFAPGF